MSESDSKQPRKRGRPKGPLPTWRLSEFARTNLKLKRERELDLKHGVEVHTGKATGEKPSLNIADMHAGVTVGWLAQVFNMDPSTVKKRLADCPPIARRKAGHVYSLPQAAAYLIKPVFDVQKYLKDMKPNDLPAQLQKEYWDAALKRQTWEERAGDLWRTSMVLSVLSDTFLMMKTRMQLWSEDISQEENLTTEQRALIIEYVDRLQNDIHDNLKAISSTTPSMKAEIPVDERLPQPTFVEDDDEEDLIG